MRSRHSFFYILIGSAVVFCLFVIGNDHLRGQSAGPAPAAVADSNSCVFRLELGGDVVAEYTECSGLGSGNDILEETVAANTLTPDALGTVIQKSPGALRWPEIKLRRKGFSSAQVWSWREYMEKGDTKNAFCDGAITIVGTTTTDPSPMRWTFHLGWAARLIFDGQMEELVIVPQGLTRATTTASTSTRATRS
jgi:hypothetical protein